MTSNEIIAIHTDPELRRAEDLMNSAMHLLEAYNHSLKNVFSDHGLYSKEFQCFISRVTEGLEITLKFGKTAFKKQKVDENAKLLK